MKGHPDVIAILNDVLAGELVAISQYFMHAKMCQNWGYLRIADKIRHESIDEMKHAEGLTERILYLEGLPNLQDLGKLNIGETVKEQFESDLALEKQAIAKLNQHMARCRDLGDNASEDLLRHILVDEEQHADWLETQLDLIAKIGQELYLSQQLHS